MKIAFIGKFTKLHDEEYIARSFESLGHDVIRIPINSGLNDLTKTLTKTVPDILLYCKWDQPSTMDTEIRILEGKGMKKVCWVFDLYIGYAREWQVPTKRMFKSDFVFTTDGGHKKEWEKYGVNHHCVRQGIFKDECYMMNGKYQYDVIFVGSESPLYHERNQIMEWAKSQFNFKWIGRNNTDEIRGKDLNTLYSRAKIVIGNSVYSPYYWSNRVVETLGRGGFLIHQEVEGLKEEYPYIVTYKRGDLNDLKQKIDYYLKHDEEREELRKKNFEWVRDHYTMDKKCAELISKL